MNAILAEASQITEYGFAGLVAVAVGIFFWWLQTIYKPRQEQLTAQEIKESDRRIEREDATAKTTQNLMDTVREAFPTLVQTISETHETNVRLHQQTQDRIEELKSEISQ